MNLPERLILLIFKGKIVQPQRTYVNNKPYRSKALKELARKKAYKDMDGSYRSSVEVLYHPKPKVFR